MSIKQAEKEKRTDRWKICPNKREKRFPVALTSLVDPNDVIWLASITYRVDPLSCLGLEEEIEIDHNSHQVYKLVYISIHLLPFFFVAFIISWRVTISDVANRLLASQAAR